MAEEDIPEGAHLILALINTRYGQMKHFHDAWPDRATMESWLRQESLIAAEAVVTEGDYRRAVTLREALRQSLRRTNDAGTTAAEALATINHIAQDVLLKVHFSGMDEVRLAPESRGVDGVLARVLGDVYTAVWTGIWTRIKVCHHRRPGYTRYSGTP